MARSAAGEGAGVAVRFLGGRAQAIVGRAAHTADQNETGGQLVASGALEGAQPPGRKLALAAAARTQSTGADIDNHARVRSFLR